MAVDTPAFFEINPKDPHHVDGPAHADLIRQRRERLVEWLGGLTVLPDVPDDKRYGKFVTYSDGLLAGVRKLVENLKHYAARKTLKRPVNVLLQAPPGSGKSSLVRSICDGLGLPSVSKLLEVNFSNLLSPGDAIPVFDRIQLLRENGMLPAAFFDEVDVPEWSVYQYLLMPMWDGAYMAHGRRHEFGGAIFFVAASHQAARRRAAFFVAESENAWVEEGRKDLALGAKADGADRKAADFYSRVDFYLTMPPMRSHFVAPFRDDKAAYWQDQEVVQLVRFLIRRDFPSVEQVDRRVLEFLGGAFLESKREVERLLFLAVVPAGERVLSFDHLPGHLLAGGPWWAEVSKRDSKPVALTAGRV